MLEASGNCDIVVIGDYITKTNQELNMEFQKTSQEKKTFIQWKKRLKVTEKSRLFDKKPTKSINCKGAKTP